MGFFVCGRVSRFGLTMKKVYILLIFITAIVSATTINVPGDYSTIQAAIDTCSNGDTVLVAAGTYVENITYNGENIVVGSLYLTTQDTSYISSTIIDGNQAGSVVAFENGEDSTAMLSGFTITNGLATSGGGIYCGSNSSPIVTDVVITGNSAYTGGGIYCGSNSNPSLTHVIITDNLAGFDSGGIHCDYSSPILTDVTIIGNTANYRGGGIVCFFSSPIFTDVTITGNMATGTNASGGGIFCWYNSNPGFLNCILWNNYPQQIYFHEDFDINSITISYSDIQGGEGGIITNDNVTVYWEEGNIFDDPLFCNADSRDYTLAENSPCVGTGENGANMGALGIGCEAIIPAPVLATIEDQQISEDGSLTVEVSATSDLGLAMTFLAYSDTSDVIASLGNTTLTVIPTPDWFGTSEITVMVTDENELSDTSDFILTVAPVNDSPEPFTLIYPTITDTFQVSTNTDETILFYWHPSEDVDNAVIYKLTVTLDYFGDVYIMEYEDITDSTAAISGYELAVLMTILNLPRWTLDYSIEASDEEYTIESEASGFVLENTSLSLYDDVIPLPFKLHQNHPNPFNPVTTLRYDLPEDAMVNITIYDMMGRQVSTLVSSLQTAGYKSVQWDATNDKGSPVSAGLYLYTIEAGQFRQTKKMVLLK